MILAKRVSDQVVSAAPMSRRSAQADASLLMGARQAARLGLVDWLVGY